MRHHSVATRNALGAQINRRCTCTIPVGGAAPDAVPKAIWLTVMGFLLTLLLPLAAFCAERRVSGAQELAAAIREAQPGDVLQLSPGQYGILRIDRKFEGKPLEIRAADPTQRPEFTGIFLHEAKGLQLEDLAVHWRVIDAGTTDNYTASSVLKSSDVLLRRILFEGDVAKFDRAEVIGYPTAFALRLRYSERITIEDSEFRVWQRGMIIGQSRDITLRGNNIHSIRVDGMNFAAVQGLLIENNWFHDFARAPDGDHPDMIQGWSNRTETPSTDIRIRNNLLNSGNGQYTQSIFIRNEEVDTGRAGREMFYRNIEITGNTIINAHLHGITLGEADGVLIASNTLLRNRRSEGPGGNELVWIPAINVSPKSDNVTITRNVVARINGPQKRPDWKVADNLLIQDKGPSQPNYYDQIFAAALTGDPGQLATFTYLADGPVDGKHLGSAGLRPEQIAAQVKRFGPAPLQAARDHAYVNRFIFDASNVLTGADAITNTEKMAPVWEFGDGSRAKGIRVSHDFPHPGAYTVRLYIGTKAGMPQTAHVVVPDPLIMRFDPKEGLIALQRPVEGGQAEAGVLHIGGTAPPVKVSGTQISGMVTRPDFALDLTLATTGGSRSAGEILRIEESFTLGILPNGSLAVSLPEPGQKTPRTLRSPPLGLNDDHPHRILVEATADLFEIHVDGRRALRLELTQPLRLAPNRPLVLGGTSGTPGVPARISDLTLTAGKKSFAR